MKITQFLKTKHSWPILGVGILALSVGVIVGWYAHDSQGRSAASVIRENSPDNKFTNPSLLFQTSENDSFPRYTPLKQALNDYVQSSLRQDATEISVYFRDMNSSKWVSVNPEETFSPASMLKVVTMIAVLHAAESKPALLSQKITIGISEDESQEEQDFYPPGNPVHIGESYTVQDLISAMIVNSDNRANSVLAQVVGSDEIKETYDTLYIPMPAAAASQVITVEDYSRLYRVLYGGTFLSHKLSEQVLYLLSKTTFMDGLVAGVPKDTVVSHKFGERTILAPPGSSAPAEHQLHDCGIIYYPQHPYLLCVMTRGSDFPKLASVIEGISRTAWGEVDKLYK